MGLKPGKLTRHVVRIGIIVFCVHVAFVSCLRKYHLKEPPPDSKGKDDGRESDMSFDSRSNLLGSVAEKHSAKRSSAVQSGENQSVESDIPAGFVETEFVSPRWLSQTLSVDFSTRRNERRSPSQWASDANRMMDRKLAAADLSPAYAAEMIATWRDRTNHELVRNFAVQHLERYARECVVRGTWDPDLEEAEKVRAALENAALEVDNSIGGTAMLALARLSEIDPHVDRRRLSSRSASLVANPSARLSTRIAAAQLCGLLRVRSALPDLRSLASDPSVPTPLRLAADHAAGLVSESR